MKDKPSDYCLGYILRAYDAATRDGATATPGDIWDHICMGAIQERGAFSRLFEWDSRKSGQNRIGTIADVIAAGYVPGLRLATGPRGRWIVVREGAT